MILAKEQKQKFGEVLKAFDEFCKPTNNESYYKYPFCSWSQEKGKSMDHFIKTLKMLARLCNFGKQEESLICDRIMLGIKDIIIITSSSKWIKKE